MEQVRQVGHGFNIRGLHSYGQEEHAISVLFLIYRENVNKIGWKKLHILSYVHLIFSIQFM